MNEHSSVQVKEKSILWNGTGYDSIRGTGYDKAWWIVLEEYRVGGKGRDVECQAGCGSYQGLSQTLMAPF